MNGPGARPASCRSTVSAKWGRGGRERGVPRGRGRLQEVSCRPLQRSETHESADQGTKQQQKQETPARRSCRTRSASAVPSPPAGGAQSRTVTLRRAAMSTSAPALGGARSSAAPTSSSSKRRSAWDPYAPLPPSAKRRVRAQTCQQRLSASQLATQLGVACGRSRGDEARRGDSPGAHPPCTLAD